MGCMKTIIELYELTSRIRRRQESESVNSSDVNGWSEVFTSNLGQKGEVEVVMTDSNIEW